jgi:hypothetical protein
MVTKMMVVIRFCKCGSRQYYHDCEQERLFHIPIIARRKRHLRLISFTPHYFLGMRLSCCLVMSRNALSTLHPKGVHQL